MALFHFLLEREWPSIPSLVTTLAGGLNDANSFLFSTHKLDGGTRLHNVLAGSTTSRSVVVLKIHPIASLV